MKGLPISELYKVLLRVISLDEMIQSLVRAELSTTICTERKMRKMNQKEFAQYMGVTQGMVSKWEKSEYDFTISELIEICNKLDLTLRIYTEPIRK